MEGAVAETAKHNAQRGTELEKKDISYHIHEIKKKHTHAQYVFYVDYRNTRACVSVCK